VLTPPVPVDPPVLTPPVPVDPPVLTPPVPVDPPVLTPPVPVDPPVLEPPVPGAPPSPVVTVGAVLLHAAAVRKSTVADAKRVNLMRGPPVKSK
jgi:hypothetical protein